MKESVAVGVAVAREFGDAYFRRRYTILFYSLIVTLVVSPLTAELGLSGGLIECLFAANLAIAVAPVQAGRRRNGLIAVLLALYVARPVGAWLGYPRLSQLTLACWTVLGLIAAGLALRFAMQSARVDGEHVCAALSAYLLAGIYLGLVYWVIEQIHAGSFSASGGLSRAGHSISVS